MYNNKKKDPYASVSDKDLIRCQCKTHKKHWTNTKT